jgi:hypothetical protein
VIDWDPAVLSVPVKVFTPLSAATNVLDAGVNTASGSLLVSATVPV